MSRLLFNLIVVLSVLLNVVTGGNAPETLSYRATKARRAGRRWGRVLCSVLDFVDPGHCERTLFYWEHRFPDERSAHATSDTSGIDREAQGQRP